MPEAKLINNIFYVYRVSSQILKLKLDIKYYILKRFVIMKLKYN
jgi:hypothetical protein